MVDDVVDEQACANATGDSSDSSEPYSPSAAESRPSPADTWGIRNRDRFEGEDDDADADADAD
eukprot:8171384-Pyramimonas_sp.AAC.1